MSKTRQWQVVIGLACLALVARISLVALWGPTSPPRYGDLSAYYDGAKELVGPSRGWMHPREVVSPSETFMRPVGNFGYRAPLYFIYLAGVFSALPDIGYRGAQIATAIFGVLTSLALFLLSGHFRDENTPWLSMALRGLLPCFVIPDTFVLSQPLSAFVMTLAIVVFLRIGSKPDWKNSALLGILVGLCALVREPATLYPVLFAFAVYLASGVRKARVVNTLTFSIALILCLLPWLWRNYVVWGRPLPLAQTAGVNLFIGNNPDATGAYTKLRFSPPSGIVLGTPEANEWYGRQALNFIVDHPGSFFVNGFKKMGWFLSPSFNRDYAVAAYRAPVKLLTLISLTCGASSALLLLLCAAGFVLHEHDRLWWLAAALIAYHLGLSFVTVGSPLYRDPVDQVLLPFGAYLVAHTSDVWARLQSRSISKQRVIVLASTLTVIFIFWVAGFLMRSSLKVG